MISKNKLEQGQGQEPDLALSDDQESVGEDIGDDDDDEKAPNTNISGIRRPGNDGDDDDDDDEEDIGDGNVDNDDDDDDDEDDDDDDDDDEKKDSDAAKSELKPDYLSQYENNFNNVSDLEMNDSAAFLQKFTSELTADYIINNHSETLSHNFEEIKKFVTTIKDSNNIIIDKFHTTNPILTKYEKTKILGIRVKQLNNNAIPYIKIGENILDNMVIANMELEHKKLPFIIQRPIPNNTFEYWKLEDLEIL
jgi:DNA-directed RNA polymerase subunit K/omega